MLVYRQARSDLIESCIVAPSRNDQHTNVIIEELEVQTSDRYSHRMKERELTCQQM